MSGGAPDRLRERLARLAGDITDDVGVDWDGELELEPGERRHVEGLQLVAEVAGVHRRLRLVEPAAAPLFDWGPLRVLEPIGAGGFGEVYRAWDGRLQREVALKLSAPVGSDAPASDGAGSKTHGSDAPGSHRRWLDEGRKLARVRHPHVLAVYGADVHDDRAGIWTDLIVGKTLEELLAEQGTFGAREAALIGADLCAALSAVHAAGLVHGDIKAQNVMREDGGRVVLMDFGSALGGDEWRPSAVTPLSAAPEMLEGAPADPRSDVYAVGALLYRLVSGQHPLIADTLDQLRRQHVQGARRPLRELRPDLPAGFIAVVERALSASPADRFASAAEMERALAAQLDGAKTRGGGVSATTAAGTGYRNRRRAIVAGSLLAVAAIAVLVLVPRFRARLPAAVSDGAAGVVDAAVHASLLRVTRGGVEPLADGVAVHPGEHLALEIEADRPMYVYVLNEDDRGDAYVLFPVPQSEVANPLAPHVRHRLPGRTAGASIDWVVTSAGGRERFLVVASREALHPLEALLRSVPPSAPDQPVAYARLTDEALADLRGVGGTRPTSQAPAGTLLTEVAVALAGSRGDRASVWVQRFELVNPGQ